MNKNDSLPIIIKIFQYNHSMYPILDGSSNYIKDIVTSISGHKFEVLTKGLIGYPSEERISNNAVIKRFCPKDFLRLVSKSSFRFLFYPFCLVLEWVRLYNEYKYMKESKYDILHVHSIDASISWHLCNRFKLFFFMNIAFCIIKLGNIDKKKILTIHGLPIERNPLFDKYMITIINYFDNVVCVDHNIVDYINSLLKDEPICKKIYYVPNAVDTSVFKYEKKVRQNYKISVGFIGRLEFSRGVDLLVELIDNLPTYIKLIVVGAGNELSINEFKRRVDMSKVKFYSNIPNDQIPTYIHKFDVLFNPVLAEGISKVTLEAMSCGCPVIMINKGIRYPVIHKNTGFLVEPKIGDVLETLEYIYNENNLLDEMGLRARSIIESKFSTESFAQRYKTLYKSILNVE